MIVKMNTFMILAIIQIIQMIVIVRIIQQLNLPQNNDIILFILINYR